ncbi:hypothetical protein KBD87_01840 [Candidatus Saccharibacteria bacterium]|nr:hypothetical protein [Candidatus Saccharibacteria bacterium]
MENFYTVSLVTLGVAIAVYALDSLYARRWLSLDKNSISFISAAILIGIFGEVFVETIYTFLFHQPLWHYQFLPVHATYTSYFSIVLWTMYGLHLYWVDQTLRQKYGTLPRWKLASVFAIESLLLETFANIVWLVVFGYFIYYYTPADLWHATTIQNIPCYFAASWAMIATVRRFKQSPYFFFAMSILILTVFLWFP